MFAFTHFVAAPETPASEAIAKVSGWDGTASSAPAQAQAAGDAAPAERRAGAAQKRPPEPPPPAPAKVAERRSPSEIARDALRSTVFVRGGRVYGAGILLDARGHVLTCQHVIAGLSQIAVSFSDGSTFEATVVDSDAKLDVALLKIAAEREPVLEPASITSVELGDDVFAIGAPRKMAFSLGRGMVSYIGRRFDGVFYLQTDLAMNGGSSGGPVLDNQGRLIALSSFVLRDSEGLAFALPIEYAYRRFAAHLQTPKALEGSARSAFEGWLATLGRAQQVAAVDPAAR